MTSIYAAQQALDDDISAISSSITEIISTFRNEVVRLSLTVETLARQVATINTNTENLLNFERFNNNSRLAKLECQMAYVQKELLGAEVNTI